MSTLIPLALYTTRTLQLLRDSTGNGPCRIFSRRQLDCYTPAIGRAELPTDALTLIHGHARSSTLLPGNRISFHQRSVMAHQTSSLAFPGSLI